MLVGFYEHLQLLFLKQGLFLGVFLRNNALKVKEMEDVG